MVEIASPSQFQPEMGEKAMPWLDRGVHLVWVVWPERHAIDIWMAGDAIPRTLGDTDFLDGGEVVPGFRLALTDLWAE